MRRSALPSVTRRVNRLGLAAGLFLCASQAQAKCWIAVEQPEAAARWRAEQEAAGQLDANITDLSSVLKEVATLYPESSSGARDHTFQGSVVTETRINLSRTISENEVERVRAQAGAKISLCDSIAEAEAELSRRSERMPVPFDPFPEARGTLGEAAAFRSEPARSIIIFFRRRNAVVYVGYEAPARGQKKGRDRPYQTIPAPTIEEKAITLAKTIDQLLISAK